MNYVRVYKSHLFCCYSSDLKKYLHANGLKYELCALNPNNHQMFWVYMRCEELDRLLNEWDDYKSS